jgi:hypothetical protein
MSPANRYDLAFPVRQLGLNDRRELDSASKNPERKFSGAGKIARLARRGLVDAETATITKDGIKGVELANELNTLWGIIPYKAKRWFKGTPSFGVKCAELATEYTSAYGDNASAMLADALDFMRNAASRWRRRNSASYGGGDLFDANRGVYDLNAQCAMAEGVIEALAKTRGDHAQFCADFLGL